MKWSALIPLLSFLCGVSSPASDLEKEYRDLLPMHPPVADADNGWLLLKDLPKRVERKASESKKLVTFPEKDSEEHPMGVDQALLAEYLADNAEMLATGRRILKSTGWQTKEGLSSLSLLTDYRASDLMFMTKAILAQAQVQALEGKTGPALGNVLEVMKLGQRMNLSEGTAVQTLTGVAVVKLGARHAAWIGPLNSDSGMIRKWAKELLPFEDTAESLRCTLRGEFRFTLQRVDLYQEGGEPLKRYFVENYVGMDRMERTMGSALQATAAKGVIDGKVPATADYPTDQNLAMWMAAPPLEVLENMEMAKKLGLPAVLKEVAQLYREVSFHPAPTFQDFRKAHPKPDPKQKPKDLGQVGIFRLEINEVAGGPDLLSQVFFEQTAQVRLTRLALCVKAWSLEHEGNLPESLESLVPAYFPSVPLDPFDGQQVRYDQASRRLWCIGKDLKDDHGKDLNADLVQAILE